MNLKKIGKVFTSKFVGTGPSSYKKRNYRAAVSQRLRNSDVENDIKKMGIVNWRQATQDWSGRRRATRETLVLLGYWSHRKRRRRNEEEKEEEKKKKRRGIKEEEGTKKKKTKKKRGRRKEEEKKQMKKRSRRRKKKNKKTRYQLQSSS